MKVRQYKGFAPYKHQNDVIEELRNAKGTNKIVVCKSSRQKGKSFMIANLLLYYSINYANTKNYCLSPSFKQAKNIYQVITDAIIKSGVVKAKNKTDLIITLINGSTINFKSAEQRDQLRGYTADFVCIDEAAFIPDSIFHIVLPWTDAKKAPMLIVSSPFTKNGFFYQYYNYGLNHQFSTTTIDWSDEKYKESIEQILPSSKLEEYRQVQSSDAQRLADEWKVKYFETSAKNKTNINKIFEELVYLIEANNQTNIQNTSNQNEHSLYNHNCCVLF